MPTQVRPESAGPSNQCFLGAVLGQVSTARWEVRPCPQVSGMRKMLCPEAAAAQCAHGLMVAFGWLCAWTI